LEEPTWLGQRPPPLRGTVNGGIVKTQDTDDFFNFLVACGKFSEKIQLKKDENHKICSYVHGFVNCRCFKII